MNNYAYPAGADNANAPWNATAPAPILRECEVGITLVKTIDLATTDYMTDDDGEEIVAAYHDWASDYEAQRYTLPRLLDELAKYIKGELMNNGLTASRRAELKSMLTDCQGWEIGEQTFDEL